MTANTVSRLRHLQVPIGYPMGTAGSATFVGGVKIANETTDPAMGTVGNPIHGVVSNRGRTPFTLAIHQSTDNAAADPYAAINMRVNGAAVASVVVVPGARVVFSLETVTKSFLKVHSLASASPLGEVTLSHALGSLSSVRTPLG